MPFTLATLTTEQLYDPLIRKEVLYDGEEYVRYTQSREALALAQKLEKLLLSSVEEKNVFAPYRSLLHRCYYTALPLLYNDEEIAAVFREHTADILRDAEYNWDDRLRAKLVIVPVRQRDALKEKMRKALYQNAERLTRSSLVMGEKEAAGTVGNWLHDFIAFMGAGRRSSLAEAQYVTEHKNVARLAEDEKSAVKRLIALYQRLKIPAMSPAGIEEEVSVYDVEGNLIDFNRGNPVYVHTGKSVSEIRLPPMRANAALPDRVVQEQRASLSSFEGTAVVASPPAPSAPSRSVPPPIRGAGSESAKIQAAMAQLRSRGNDPVAIFFDVIAPRQGTQNSPREEYIAALLLLAEANMLEKAISTPSVRDLFITHLKSKNAPDLLQGFRLAPAMPKFMILFLRWALEEKAQLAENDAARVGAQLVSILKKRGNEKYGRIVYYDAASGQFRWS